MYILTIYKKGKRKMKKNILKKTFSFLVAMIVAGSVMTSSINLTYAKTISSRKSVLVGQTITVIVRKGKKQKSSDRSIATVSKKYSKKRKRVTVRRKGKKIRKWKKVKVFKGYFSIRGIRAGKAVITIRSGKTVYRYNVTVKGNAAGRKGTVKRSGTGKSHSSGNASASQSGDAPKVIYDPRPEGMTVPKNEPVIDEPLVIDRMHNQDRFYNTVNNVNGDVMAGSTVLIKWKTNLKSDYFYLIDDKTGEIMPSCGDIAEKRYHSTDGNGAATKVSDGYVFAARARKAGTYKMDVAVAQPYNPIYKTGQSITVTFDDYRTAEDRELDDLLERSGASSRATVKEKLERLGTYMRTTGWKDGGFAHPDKYYNGVYADKYGDGGVWFQSRVISCVYATDIIEKCAMKLGVPASGLRYNHPDRRNPAHVNNLITYNGETFVIEGCPYEHVVV